MDRGACHAGLIHRSTPPPPCQVPPQTLPATVARWAPVSMGFSRQEYWSGLPCPPPGDLLNPGIEPRSASQADSSPSGRVHARSCSSLRCVSPSSAWRHTLFPHTGSAESGGRTHHTFSLGFRLLGGIQSKDSILREKSRLCYHPG